MRNIGPVPNIEALANTWVSPPDKSAVAVAEMTALEQVSGLSAAAPR